MTSMLVSFFKRLEPLETILRIILSHARISALLTFRDGHEHKVLLDFSSDKAQVVVYPPTRSADIYVTVDAPVMHEVLLGHMNPGVAVSRRAMLLRGSPHHLARFIPLFDFGPVLYREHLCDLDSERSDVYLIPEMSCKKESSMGQNTYNGNPLAPQTYPVHERVLFWCIGKLSYLVGYAMGMLRYRLLRRMSLFDVLLAMSKGLAAAMPMEKETPRRISPDK